MADIKNSWLVDIKFADNGKFSVLKTVNEFIISVDSDNYCTIVDKDTSHFSVHPTRPLVITTHGTELRVTNLTNKDESILPEIVWNCSSDDFIAHVVCDKNDIFVLTHTGNLFRWEWDENNKIVLCDSTNRGQFGDTFVVTDDRVTINALGNIVVIDRYDFNNIIDVIGGHVDIYGSIPGEAINVHTDKRSIINVNGNKLKIYRCSKANEIPEPGNILLFNGCFYTLDDNTESIWVDDSSRRCKFTVASYTKKAI